MKELTIEEKARAYDEALERARKLKENPQGVFYEYSPDEGDTICDYIFPELKEESEDEKIREELIKFVKVNIPDEERYINWLEKQCELVNSLSKGLDNAHERIDELIRKNNELCIKLESQGEIDKISYEIAEKEKREFVGDGFIECHADFLDFKEGNTYWLEYIGDDEYNVRSDNLLGKTYHITPCQLYTVFKKQTWLEKQGGQIGSDVKDYNSIDPYFAKPIDNVKPKFKVGDWIVNNISKDVFLIKSVNSGYCTLEDTKGNIYSPCLPFESDFHLWTIEDARPGDVLATEPIDSYPFPFVVIYKNNGLDFFNSYCFIGFDGKFYEGETGHSVENIHPATKEQRELLFEKMEESGHKWNDKKKELEKIEQKQDSIIQINPSEYINDMGGNGCYLKNTTQVSAWSEEDKYMIKNICHAFEKGSSQYKWLKSLKSRILPQSKQEWTEDDKNHMASILTTLLMEAKNAKIEQYRSSVESDIDWIYSLKNKDRVQPKQKWSEEDEANSYHLKTLLENLAKDIKHEFRVISDEDRDKYTAWLNSLRNRITWKPSEEQMDSLRGVINSLPHQQVLFTLYDDLKKLTE